MSTQPSDLGLSADPTVRALIAAVGATAVTSVEDLDRFAADIWDSEEELDSFLEDVLAGRNADLA